MEPQILHCLWIHKNYTIPKQLHELPQKKYWKVYGYIRIILFQNIFNPFMTGYIVYGYIRIILFQNYYLGELRPGLVYGYIRIILFQNRSKILEGWMQITFMDT